MSRRRPFNKLLWLGPPASILERLFLALALSALFAAGTHATVVPAVGLDQMISDAELIVHGAVSYVETHWSEDRSTIYTFVTFEVKTLVHGEYSDRWLTLRFEGGNVDEYRLEVDGMPTFREGDEEILFVRGNGLAVSPIVGLFQGRFKSINGLVHDHAGTPIVRISEGALVKLLDDQPGETLPSVSIGSPEGRIYVYDRHPDHDSAEALLMSSELETAEQERYPDEAPGKGTGIDDTHPPDPAVAPPPLPIEAGVAIQPADEPVAVYLDPSEDTGERLSVEELIDVIRSRLDK